MGMKREKGLSPVVATILLVAMVIVIGLIIFLWFRGMSEEKITKFGDENIKLACDDVKFEAEYSGNTLSLANSGDVPIFGMEVKVYSPGSHTTEDLREFSDVWPDSGLNQGGTFSDSIVVDGDEITLIPVLLGESENGKRTFVCDEVQHGISLNVL